MKLRENDIVHPASTTFTWLLTNENYVQWVGQKQRLLWIKGKPGAGKSTLLKYALDQNRTQKSDSLLVVAAFFIHGRGQAIQKNRLGLLRYLLHQILEQIPEMLSKFSLKYQKRCKTEGEVEKQWNWHVEDILSFLETSLPHLSRKYLIRIFVDALDESTDESEYQSPGNKVAHAIIKDFERLTTCVQKSTTDLSICFSCRHHQSVQFNQGLDICIENETVEDIPKYVAAELTQQPFELKEADLLQEKIVRRAEGVFQWVVLVIPMLVEKYRKRGNINDVIKTLNQIPPKLEDLYLRILDNLDKEDYPQILKLMQWICFPERPLSLTELRSAIVLDANANYKSPKVYEASDSFVTTDDKMEMVIKSLSGGLAEVKVRNNQRVAQLIHQSVNDYLLQSGLQKLECKPETKIKLRLQCLTGLLADFTVGQAHFQLSRSCIQYISTEKILSSSSKDSSQLQVEFPLLKYASTTWIFHAEAVEEELISQLDLIQSLQWPSEQILHVWIGLSQKFAPYSRNTPASGSNLLHVASKHCLVTLVQALVSLEGSQNVGINVKDGKENTALHWGIENGHAGIVELLLKNGAEVEGTYFLPVRKLNRNS